MRKFLQAMKKVLPLLLLVLMAFSSCQRGPVMYEMAEKPTQVIDHVEKFVNQTEKRSKHYSAEDWQVAVEQFVAMTKNYFENLPNLSSDDQMRFDNARIKFMSAIDANGNTEIARQVKEVYSQIMQ